MRRFAEPGGSPTRQVQDPLPTAVTTMPGRRAWTPRARTHVADEPSAAALAQPDMPLGSYLVQCTRIERRGVVSSGRSGRLVDTASPTIDGLKPNRTCSESANASISRNTALFTRRSSVAEDAFR